MNITEKYLKKVIQEELNYVLLERETDLEEGALKNLIFGALALVASQIGASKADAQPVKDKQQAIMMAKQNPGKIFSYKAGDITYAVARGKSEPSQFVDTGIASSHGIKNPESIKDISPEEGYEILNDYLERYQNNPKFKEYVLKNKSDPFLEKLANTNVDSALRMYDEEYKNWENDEGSDASKKFLAGGFNLVKKLVKVDLGLEDL